MFEYGLPQAPPPDNYEAIISGMDRDNNVHGDCFVIGWGLFDMYTILDIFDMHTSRLRFLQAQRIRLLAAFNAQNPGEDTTSDRLDMAARRRNRRTHLYG